MQPAGAIPLYKYTGIFPSSKLGKPATAAPMAPDCTDLVVNFIWKGIFCLHYSRVSQSINRYGDESSSWIHQQGSGTKPKTIFMLFIQEPEVLTVPARYPPSNHLLSPGTKFLSCLETVRNLPPLAGSSWFFLFSSLTTAESARVFSHPPHPSNPIATTRLSSSLWYSG